MQNSQVGIRKYQNYNLTNVTPRYSVVNTWQTVGQMILHVGLNFETAFIV